jgi:hypothetical protein
MFLYSFEIANPVTNKNYTRGLVVGVALFVVTIMLLSSFSGAVYNPGGSSQSQSSGSHVYLVTTSVGGKNSSFYE